MVKISCVKHPLHAPLIIKYKWQMDACNGDGCAAGLLSFFEYWHNVKLKAQEQVLQEEQSDNPSAYLLQWHTSEDLKLVVIEYNEKRIRAALQFLVRKGFVSI